MTRHSGYVPMERVDKELWYKEQIAERDKRRKYEKKKKEKTYPVTYEDGDV